MKTTTLLMMGAGFVLTSMSGLAETTAASELERGVELMATEATLGKAIPHFEAVIRQGDDSSRLTAEAWYHLARCHLALNDKAAALRCVAKLHEGWPADNEWVLRAARLPLRLGIFREAPWASGELLTYGINDGGDAGEEPAGRFSTLVVPSGREGEQKWTIFGMGDTDISKLEFGGDDYRPIKGRLMDMHIGDQVIETDGDGNLVASFPARDEPEMTFATGGGRDAVYHNDQMMDLVRVLPGKPGGTFELKFISPELPALTPNEPVPFKFTVIREEAVEVPAGKFDCVVFLVENGTTSEGYTIWVEKEGQRRVAKMTIGGSVVTITLLSARAEWDLEKSQLFKTGDKAGSMQFKVPPGLVALAKHGEMPSPGWLEGEQVALYDTRLRVWGGLIVRLPVPAELRAGMEAAFSPEDIPAMVERLKEQFSLMTPDPVEVKEIKEARKLINEDGDTSSIIRLKIERGTLKHERTMLSTPEKDSVILLFFDHEIGAGEAAVQLLMEIRRSL
jgi:hypothetical protein